MPETILPGSVIAQLTGVDQEGHDVYFEVVGGDLLPFVSVSEDMEITLRSDFPLVRGYPPASGTDNVMYRASCRI